MGQYTLAGKHTVCINRSRWVSGDIFSITPAPSRLVCEKTLKEDVKINRVTTASPTHPLVHYGKIPPSVPIESCLGKECGIYCSTSDNPDGICDGNGYCIHPEYNPCSHHGCVGLRSGAQCLEGDILGRCDTRGKCQF